MGLIIPIFPLKLVVFPNSKYPLHIFEPRYKSMINKCIKDDSGFGIVPSVGENIFEMGVYVTITDVLKRYDNGEFDIVVQGHDRFLIINTTQHVDGYYVSEIESYMDNLNEVDFSLVDVLQKEFGELLKLANYRLGESFWKRLSDSEL
jgi:Lon protease-like protein